MIWRFVTHRTNIGPRNACITINKGKFMKLATSFNIVSLSFCLLVQTSWANPSETVNRLDGRLTQVANNPIGNREKMITNNPNSPNSLKIITNNAKANRDNIILNNPKSINSTSGGVIGTGGGWKYYYTTSSHLSHIKSFVANAIRDTSVEQLQSVANRFGVTINFQEFANVIEKTTAKTNSAPVTGVNPAGDEDVKIMNYDLTKREIYALQGFLDLFDKEKLEAKEVRELMRLLLHEASHLYGIGTPEDSKSRLFSNSILKLIINKWYKCASIEEDNEIHNRVAKCDYEKQPSASIDRVKPTGFIFTSEATYKAGQKPSNAYAVRIDQWRIDDNFQMKLIASSNEHTGGIKQTMTFTSIEEGDFIMMQSLRPMGYLGEQFITDRVRLSTIENPEKLILDGTYNYTDAKSSMLVLKATFLVGTNYVIKCVDCGS